MANPSLQIGNGKWAIKEDNLLGYSKAGTRFVPEPITMTRESAGTRVNSSGLVETVELLGSEDVVNGSFTTDSDWNTSATGISIAGGKLLRDATATLSIVQLSSVITPSVTYKITFEIVDYTSGTLTPRFGWNGTGGTAVSGVGTYTQIITKVNQNVIELYGTAFIGSITNVSVKEVTKNNLARVDYDGAASSLLAEPMRTNLLTYSEDFSQGVWVKTDANIVSNFGISPSGNLDADKITFDTTNVQARAQVNLSGLTSGNEYNQSYYLKSLGSDVTLRIGTSGAVAGEFVDVIATSEWQRFDITTTASGTTEYPRFQNINGIINTEILVWGAQMEAGSYATSYIPTDGSTVTRVQDQYSKTGISNLINSEEGVLFVEIASLSESGNYRELGLSDGTTSNRVLISYKSTDNVIRGSFQGSGGANLEYTVTSSKDFHKIAVKWKVNDFALWVDGVEVGSDTSGSSFPADTLNSLALDDGGGASKFFGKVKQLQVFKTALTDSELIALTT